MKRVSLKCGSCGETVTIPQKARGMRIHCPSCKQQIVVPKREPPRPVALPTQSKAPLASVESGVKPKRFPTWLVPTLVAGNGFLLAVLLFASIKPRPATSARIPLTASVVQAQRRPSRSTKEEQASQRSEKEGGSALTSEAIYRKCAPATVSIVSAATSGDHIGSGFLVSTDGYILTNHHVVENASRVHILTESGTHLLARVIDSWPEMDIALLKVAGRNHAAIPLADSDAVEIGSSVLAIGTPQDLGLAQSITQGIISGRRLFAGVPCYQTSALINHGNSGGPLLNMRGEAVGIATFVTGTALVTPQGNIGSDIQGINFAVEINLAKKLLQRNSVGF